MGWESIACGIYSWFQGISDVIWAGVVASALTLSGVIFTNRGNANRLKEQLSHDASEKAKERIFLTRRDVYLKATEELVKANAYMAAIPTLDATKTNLSDGLNNLLSSLSKVQLISETEASKASTSLISAYGSMFFTAIKHLPPVASAKTSIDLSQEFYNSTQNKIQQILDLKEAQNRLPNPDAGIVEYLDRQYQAYQRESEHYSKELNSHWKTHNLALEEFHTHLMGKVFENLPLQIELMKEIRRDLGLDADISEIEKLMDEQVKVMQEHMKETMQSLKQHYAEE